MPGDEIFTRASVRPGLPNRFYTNRQKESRKNAFESIFFCGERKNKGYRGAERGRAGKERLWGREALGRGGGGKHEEQEELRT